MNQFLSGGLMVACWVVGLFFFKFWKGTRDRLFLIFGMAFWLLAAERVALAFINTEVEWKTYVYLIRLVAFTLILAAVFDKNRAGR